MNFFKKSYKNTINFILRKFYKKDKVETDVVNEIKSTPKRFRILCLSGGGAKGFYSLGFLKELEKTLNGKLNDNFDLVFGTSTGAIISTLICSGYKVDDIVSIYRDGVPKIMSKMTSSGRTGTLMTFANKVFKHVTFNSLKPMVGIVSTNQKTITPVVFVSTNKFKNKDIHIKYPFVDGSNYTIADLIQSSCAAHPFFKPKTLHINNEEVNLIDGGYCGAVNPSIQACNYAINQLGVKPENIDIISVGVGHYPDPRKGIIGLFVNKIFLKHYAKKYAYVDDLDMSERISQLYPKVKNIHIDEVFTDGAIATDMLEKKVEILDDMFSLGKKAFIKNKDKLLSIMLLQE